MKEFVRALIPNINNDRYLVIHEKRGRLEWNFPGGKVKGGESHSDACKREVFEETSVEVLKLERIFSKVFSFEEEDWIGHYYLIQKSKGCINLLEAKSVAYTFISPYEIINHDNLFISAIRPFLLE